MNLDTRLHTPILHLRKLIVTASALLMLSGCTVFSGSQSKKNQKEEVILSEKDMMDFTRLFFDGNKAKILGDYGKAKKLFQQALKIDPRSAATQFELAKLYAEEGRYMESIDMAREAREGDPDNIWFAHFLAQLYAETGQLERSVEVFKELIASEPEEYDNYYNLASLLAAQGQYDEALAIYQDLIDIIGPNEDISVQKQLIYLEKEDYERALKEVIGLIDANPAEIRYYGMKAEILQQMGREEEALELYEIMLAESPENGLVLLALHELYSERGDKDKAETYLKRAFASTELNVDLKVNILLNYLSGRQFRERPEFVMALGEKLEVAHPTEAKAYAIQGDILYNLEKIEEARDKFRKAVKLDANRPPIWQQILTIDSQLNDFESMASESESALELFPMQPIFYLFSGVAQLQLKQVDDAIDMLETGVSLVVDNDGLKAQFYTSLGDAYHEAGKHAKSDAAYTKALEIDKSNPLVLNNFAYYLSLRGERLEEAEKMAKKANNLSPDQASFQDTYGWVLYMRGNYRNALFWIEEALKNGADNDPVVLEHHGDVLQALGRSADAVRSWQQAIDAGGNEDAIRSKINSASVGE